MKLTVVGAGGFRTPAIYRALVSGVADVSFDEIVLYDADDSRFGRITSVLDGIDRELGASVGYRMSTDLRDAVEGADVVYCAIRVGGLEGRLKDERIAVDRGVIGQETTGPGGIAFALRTVPAVMAIAEQVVEHAPDALFINFTNPAGLVTEALQAGAGRPRGRHLRRPARPLQPGCRRCRAAAGAALVRLLRHQPPGLAARGDPPRPRPAPGAAGGHRAAGGLRGGPPVRGRVAPGDRDDPERVPLLLLLPARGARVHAHRQAAGRGAARAAARVLRRATAATLCRTGGLQRRAGRPPTWPRPGRPRACRRPRSRRPASPAATAASPSRSSTPSSTPGRR